MALHHVIDLTIDDEDNNKLHEPAPFAFRPISSITPASTRSPQALPIPAHTTTISPQEQPATPLLANGNDRPAKRRKLDASDRHGVNGAAQLKSAGVNCAARQIDRDALMACLQLQVIPHLDAALNKLPEGMYNTADLGKTIIGQVADKDFETHFRRGNGSLSHEMEINVATRIQQLVNQLIKLPAYRAPSSVPIHSQPPSRPSSIITSIEAERYRTPGSYGTTPHDELFDSVDEGLLGPDSDDELGEDEELGSEPWRATTPPPLLPKKKPLITPQRFRTRAKASQWQSGKAFESEKEGTPEAPKNQWFGLRSRPYLTAPDRQRLIAGTSNSGRLIRLGAEELRQPCTIHVDFGEDEVKYLRYLARALYGRDATRGRDYQRDLRHLLKKDVADLTIRNGIIEVVRSGYKDYRDPPLSLLARSDVDVDNYLADLFYRRVNSSPKSFRIERDDGDKQIDVSRANVVPSLLLAREIGGNHPLSIRRYQNLTTTFKTNREDALEPRIEWTGCAGDITTLSWLSNAHFVCGTTTHSDSHNQQYNKPGNLLLGSATSKTLRAYPDHRIIRPIVSQGDNALESMRESQDPWLFTSVVSSDYEPVNDLAFTSSFDKTVKVWRLDGDKMDVVGTWGHEGHVNFVVASKHPLGMIATAADVPTNAVRVYKVNMSDISASRFDAYSCTRVHDEDYVPSEKWAYFPSAIRWGLAPKARDQLLIGYSPRPLPGSEDHDIPEDRRNTGELCLWNTVTGTQVKVNSAATQNVFEVVWHPARESFAAATSASGLELEGNVNTQIRIFEKNEGGAYTAIKTLDCPAIDINEISLRCTDGNVYVWDSALSDLPICTLEHGDPVEELLGEREQEDVGAKFTAWGTTADRLYTGSSDGVIKVWNIRHGRAVLVKDLIEASGPIMCGAFSPDFTKLAVGDGTGRVYVMALDEDDEQNQGENKGMTTVSSGFLQSSAFLRLQRGDKQQAIRRPRPFIPHGDVPPPDGPPESQLGRVNAKEFLRNGELVIHPDESIGAVQGPNYANTGLFREEAHLNGDVHGPLLGGFEALQQENTRYPPIRRFPRQQEIIFGDSPIVRDTHMRNAALDIDIEGLHIDTRSALEAERAELNPYIDFDLSYEEEENDNYGLSE
ncbi:hypothetical protein DL764_005070 [Monosporascus ibericus]|uniref:Uncharacterized protein n=1 Tax=Monosporascus ibericus TaxID=155417 RepID=A0A4V1XAQ5_9PEZI|nr:hypothetical protein DL764_005070 [Monosporascus ibericus]